MGRNIVTGIDVGTHTVRVVVAELSPDSGSPHIIGKGIAESRGLRNGYIMNSTEAARSIRAAIRNAERSAGVRIRTVFLAIGGISLEAATIPGATMISRADGEVTDLDLENALNTCEERAALANRKVIERVPIAYKLDGKEVYGRPIGMKGTKLEIRTLFVTCVEQHFNELIEAVEEANVEVEDVIPAPIAASLVALTKRQRTVGCLLANIGAETVSIAVFEDDLPMSLEVFPIGSTDITNDIALGFRIPLEEAEQLKMGGSSSVPKRKLDDIIQARLSDIFDLVEAHLKKIGRHGLLPAGIVLTGGGAGISTIEDFAKGALELPSRLAEPTFGTKDIPFQDSSWFVAYGLCIFGFNQTRPSRGGQPIKGALRSIASWFKQLLP
jgi:cell division protein FtsA